MLVVLCRVDVLEDDETINSIQEYVDRAPKDVGSLVSECGGRYVGFNNKCKKDSVENKKQARELLKMVKRIRNVRAYRSPHYTIFCLLSELNGHAEYFGAYYS